MWNVECGIWIMLSQRSSTLMYMLHRNTNMLQAVFERHQTNYIYVDELLRNYAVCAKEHITGGTQKVEVITRLTGCFLTFWANHMESRQMHTGNYPFFVNVMESQLSSNQLQGLKYSVLLVAVHCIAVRTPVNHMRRDWVHV